MKLKLGFTIASAFLIGSVSMAATADLPVKALPPGSADLGRPIVAKY